MQYQRVGRGRISALIVTLVLISGAAACDSGSSSDDDPAGASEAADDAIPTEPVDVGTRTHVTSAGGNLTIETSSARAAYVSGGDVLVTVTGAAAQQDLRVTVNDADVTDRFRSVELAFQGLLTGLDEGANEIVAEADGERVTIAVTNHSKNGPMFSGPHLEPWLCTTEEQGLGPATDEDCDAPTKTTWAYVSTDGTVKDLADPAALPDDVAKTTVNGEEVLFVVRREEGVINRGIYSILIVDAQPAAASPEPDAWVDDGWNHRLVYRFGGGCGIGYTQGEGLLTDGIDVDLLGQGYAIATNTLDTFQSNCHDVLSAESAMMTREHFSEQFGVPTFTIGDGGSGGAIQQLLIAHNYPGVLDALSPSVPFPDAASVSGGVTDCGLLGHYYESAAGAALTDAQRAAIQGHASTGTCTLWITSFLSAIDPRSCGSELDDVVYDPETNPDGVRCTLQDINVNVFGRDPETGFANRALDNVGIQYGLGALEAGTISVDEFLDLNEHVGGYSIDGDFVGEREAGTELAMETAYRTGRLIGSGPLLDVPIILRNVYTDRLGDIHTRFQSFSIRDRLATDGVDNPNLLLWTTPAVGTDLTATLTGSIGSANDPVTVLDEWLTAAAAQDASRPMAERLAAAKPANATNRCTLADGTVLEGGWELYDDPGPCAEEFPINGDPRLVAGQPRNQRTLKCALTPVDPASFTVAFTDAQVQRLESIFPEGVCDWSQPGVGEQDTSDPWQSFGP